ncbi:hypothetical protein Mapa_014832 [Marchantia paleacea]|nr:hypothetical protein Mapa_014832 [Marchantia paleacea]
MEGCSHTFTETIVNQWTNPSHNTRCYSGSFVETTPGPDPLAGEAGQEKNAARLFATSSSRRLDST